LSSGKLMFITLVDKNMMLAAITFGENLNKQSNMFIILCKISLKALYISNAIHIHYIFINFIISYKNTISVLFKQPLEYISS
jgi:hypothetical protein